MTDTPLKYTKWQSDVLRTTANISVVRQGHHALFFRKCIFGYQYIRVNNQMEDLMNVLQTENLMSVFQNGFKIQKEKP